MQSAPTPNWCVMGVVFFCFRKNNPCEWTRSIDRLQLLFSFFFPPYSRRFADLTNRADRQDNWKTQENFSKLNFFCFFFFVSSKWLTRLMWRECQRAWESLGLIFTLLSAYSLLLPPLLQSMKRTSFPISFRLPYTCAFLLFVSFRVTLPCVFASAKHRKSSVEEVRPSEQLPSRIGDSVTSIAHFVSSNLFSPLIKRRPRKKKKK